MGIVTEEARRLVEEAVRSSSPLVWLDKQGVFEPLVQAWKTTPGTFPYPVFSFGGSFLELMLQSRDALAGKRSVPCLIYMKGFSENDIKLTPVLEACKAGKTWTASLEAVIRSAGSAQLTSEQIDHILSRGDLDIELAGKLADGMAGRSPELDEAIAVHGEDGLVIRFLGESGAVDVSIAALKSHFNRVFGCGDDWIAGWVEGGIETVSARELAGALAAYLLCMEYACDLSVKPPSERLSALAAMPQEYRSRASRFLRELRRTKGDLYAGWAERTETGLEDAEKNLAAEKLGKLDTFRFEAVITLDAALDAIVARDWGKALAYAEPRLLEEDSGESARTFWVKTDPSRERIWKWIQATARLGQALSAAAGAGAQPESLVSAYEAYVSSGWKVDRLHREFRLVTMTISTTTVRDRYADFLAVRSAIHGLYRAWADAQSRQWNKLCERDGFSGPRESGQRFFFGTVLEPFLRDKKKTALVLVDAFRYELGHELAGMLADYTNGSNALSSMLAELPTVTSVGMNALMPVSRDGLLEPVFDKAGRKLLGFQSGERQVTTPDTRQRALSEYAGGRCEWTDLSTFLDVKGKDLAKLCSGGLLVVTTPDIDTMGESGSDSFGIDYFQPVLARLKEAVEKLRDQGFDRIVITADHGFLLGDETVQNGHAARLEKADRRHAFDVARNGEHLVSVPVVNLGWKTDDKELALVFDAGTHLLTTAKAGTFYHGGNSLQERVIPLIVLSGGAPVRMSDGKYRIKAVALPQVFGTNRMRVMVETLGVSELFAPDMVELRLAPEAGSKLTIGDAGGSRFTGDTFDAAVGRDIVITFKLVSAAGEKSRITVSQVSSILDVQPVMTADYFDAERAVSTPGAAVQAPLPGPAGTPGAAQWTISADLIPQEYHAALQHLHRHGALTEAFLRNSLGNTPEASRKARRFTQRITE